MQDNCLAIGPAELQAGLTKKIFERLAKEDDKIYNNESIFDYIDGAGEVYRSYGMRQCLSRRYVQSGEPSITLDIFDMGTSSDAFGVFTHDTDGERIDIGHEARYRSGWLRMWKSRFFISIYGEKETDEIVRSMKELAVHVAGLIGEKGEKPSLLKQLPENGLQNESIRFFHDHFILNTHFYLSYENILNLGSETESVLAEYRIEKESAIFLIVRYASSDKAVAAYERFIAAYLPDADQKAVKQIENGRWCGVRKKRNIITAVLESGTRSLLEALFKAWGDSIK